jgi:uncharacterized protein (DUF1810 family)
MIMAIKDYFFNAVLQNGVYDRLYNSEDVTSYLDLIVGNGVFPTPSTQLQVSAAGGMTVNVNTGQGWIDGHKMINTTVMSFDIEESDVLLNRIDRVIFYVDYTLRAMGIAVKKGTPAVSAVAPALTRNAQRYELCLAEIDVSKQVTEITNSMITDTRSNSELCGFVAGLIQQMDTTNLFQQFEASFDEWFADVKDELVTATLIRKYEYNYETLSDGESTFNVKQFIPQYAYGLDILEVRINGLSLASNEFSKEQNNVVLRTPIEHAGTQIDFVIYKSVDGSDAESIVDMVYEMQVTVNTLASGTYFATGVDDNKKLSNIVKTFLNGGDDHKQLEIDVYGDLVCTVPATELTESNIAYWFDFAVQNATRRVKLNFAHCSRIVVDANNSDEATDVLIHADKIEIDNLQAVMNNVAAGNLLVGDCTCNACAFWMNGLENQTGTLIGAEQGSFTTCRMSVTASNGIAYGFSGNGNILRLLNCEILAYNGTGVSAESVAVQVKGNETENVLIMDGCSCPIKSRSGYKQSNVVKINSGLYCLTGNMLGKAALKYSTGDGKTETGTMIISK